MLYVLLLPYVMLMRAAPAARRPDIRSHVNVQIGLSVKGSRACRKSLFGHRSGGSCHWLSLPLPHPTREPERSDRESYGKARVEIHVYGGLGRLLV